MLFSVHHHFMASLGSNNFVLSLKVWIQKTDATSETKVGKKLFRFPPTQLLGMSLSNGCKSLISLVWEVGKCENRKQQPFMISIYLLPDSKRRMRLYQMVVVYYFRLIFFLISFASLNRLLAMLSLIAAICIISLW